MLYRFWNLDPLPRHLPLICLQMQIGDFLRELHETLLSLESSTSTLDDVLPAMDYILELFETKKVELKDDPVLGPCINSG
jgi:hypothetical protein